MSNLDHPSDRLYIREHTWLQANGEFGTIGVTDFAQDQLGEVLFVDLPAVGARVSGRQPFGSIESMKSISDLYSPVTGVVTAVNPALESQPELVNSSPYEVGWLIKVRIDDPAEVDQLLDAGTYLSGLQDS